MARTGMKKILIAVALFLFMILNAQVKIAVIDFEGKNVAKTDASALTDRLRAELFLTGKFVILEREKMDAILKEQQFQLSGCTSDACAVEAGQLLAVEQIVAGSISKVGQTYSVTARLIGVEKGNLLNVGKCDLKGDIGDLMTSMSNVALQLSGKQVVPRSEPTQTKETTTVPEKIVPRGEPTQTQAMTTVTEQIVPRSEPTQMQATTTVTDIDGNTYRAVKIGDQWWMAENLKVTHYRNGDPIPNVTNNTQWSGLTTGAYCNYDNDPNNANTYGILYNWYAVNDSRDIAPEGWHVPSEAEWQTLVNYLGGSGVAGGKMKEIGTTHWKRPNEGATNVSGFAALPGGYRYSDGNFGKLGSSAYFWSSSRYNSSNAWGRVLYYGSAYVSRYSSNKQYGFSVRLVRD